MRPVDERVSLVGREREMLLLGQVMDRCRAGQQCQLVTILGAAGVGKTRLIGDFLRNRDGVWVLRSRCLAYGDSDGLWPLLEIIRQAAGLRGDESDEQGRAALGGLFADEVDGDRVVRRLAPISGYGGVPASLDETQWAVRRLVEAMSRRQPVAVVVDDLHWASSVLLDVLEHVADWATDAAALIVCGARPELLDGHPQWGGGKINSTTLTLQRLDEAGSDQLIRELLGSFELSTELWDRVRLAADGMPLYVEQMVAMLIEGDPDADVSVPPTIAALLSARFDNLPPAEQELLEVASVVGQTFYRGAVEELVSVRIGSVEDLLATLIRKDFLQPAEPDLPGEDAVRFRHVLVRDTAYAAMPKQRRSVLHERFGRWLEKRPGSMAEDLERFVVHHLAEAVELRDQLGPRDEATAALAAEAVDRLVRLATALGAVDVAAAGRLTEQAASLIEDPAARARLLVARVRLFQSGGSLAGVLDECVSAVGRAHDAASQAGDVRLLQIVELQRDELNTYLQPDSYSEGQIETLDEQLSAFIAAGDDEGIVAAASAKMNYLSLLSSWEAMQPLIEVLRGVSARLHDPNLARSLLIAEAGVLVYGPRPATEGIARLQEMQEETPERRVRTVLALNSLPLLAMSGRLDEARRTAVESERLRHEVGAPPDPVLWAFMVGIAECRYGDPIVAETAITTALERLDEEGEIAWASTLLVELAEAELSQGQVADATTLTLRARDIAPDLDTASQSSWRRTLAKIHLQRGEIAEADKLVRVAFDYAVHGDQLEGIGRLHHLAGEVHLAAGRRDAAKASLDEALDCFRRKGATVYADSVAAELADL